MSAVLAMQAAAPVAYGQGAPTFSATQVADAASNAVAQPGAVETRVAQTIRGASARGRGRARDGRASLDGQFLRSQAQANVLVQQGVQWANETGLPWLRRLEGNVNYDFSGRDVAVDVRTIDALHLDQDRALLLQLGGHNQNHRPTINAGVVARSAAGASLILGGNAFLDYEVGKRHLRGSLGAEAVAPQFTLYGNVYAPLSGWKAAKRAERREERPARRAGMSALRRVPKRCRGWLSTPSISAGGERRWITSTTAAIAAIPAASSTASSIGRGP